MMHVTREQDQGRLLVTLTGEVDAPHIEAFRHLCEELAAANWPEVEVDASKLSFIYSEGLGALVAAQTRLRERGLDLRVVNPSHVVLELLSLTRLDGLLCQPRA